MSYDIGLHDPVTGERLQTEEPHHLTGGTYCLGGTTELWLNVTYNYAPHFYRLFPGGEEGAGIRWLYGQLAADTIPVLEEVISKLADDVDEDYWKATEGNAKQALFKLLAMAKMRPDGRWDGD